MYLLLLLLISDSLYFFYDTYFFENILYILCSTQCAFYFVAHGARNS